MDKKKRYQECNWLVKLWRRRWYIPIPFKWFWAMYIKSIIVYPTTEEDGDEFEMTGKMLWRVLIGSAQCDMNWTYTSEEVLGKFKRDDSIQEEED